MVVDTQNEIDKLTKKRDELRQRLVNIENDYRQGLDADPEERAIQLENADVLEGIAKATAEELDRIEAQIAQLK